MMRFIPVGAALAMLFATFPVSQSSPVNAAGRAFPLILSAQSNSTSAAQELRQRFELGLKQARNGQYPQALQHFLWLWDLEPKKAGSIRGIRTTRLLSEIARIAEVYPPGLEAIKQRIAILQEKWSASQDRTSLSDLFALGKTFPLEVDSLALFDQIEDDSPLKYEFSHNALDGLLAAERYKEIVEYYKPLVQLERVIVVSKRQDAQMKDDPRGELLKARTSEFLRSKATKEIHALLAANEESEARKYVEMYIAYDSSEEAKAAIKSGAANAGRPNFFEDL